MQNKKLQICCIELIRYGTLAHCVWYLVSLVRCVRFRGFRPVDSITVRR
jgi:hypothetical protein